VENYGKLNITVSSNVPTDVALKNFQRKLYEMLLDSEQKKTAPCEKKAVKTV